MREGGRLQEADWACVAQGPPGWWKVLVAVGDTVDTLPTLLSLCFPVLAQEHLSVSHNNLTTLHGELSSLPSLRVSAAGGCQAWVLGPESSQWCEGWAKPQAGPAHLSIPCQTQGPLP